MIRPYRYFGTPLSRNHINCEKLASRHTYPDTYLPAKRWYRDKGVPIQQQAFFLLAMLIGCFALTICHAETTPTCVKKVLPNGLTVIVKSEDNAGIVAIETFIKVGAAEERESNAGIGNMVARALLASTRNKRAETVATVVDEVGGNFQTNWQPDYTEIKAITTTAGFDEVIRLLGDILNNANFEPKWIDQARQEALKELTTQGDDVFQTTYDELKRNLYQDNPYHRPSGGYVRTIKAITPADMLRFYQQYYVPNNIVVSIVGDVTMDHALERLKLAFAGTSAKSLPKNRPIPPETLPESRALVLERPINAAYIMFAFLAPSVTSPDYPAARVAASALGSGKGSRMFQELREKKGLAYELGTIYPTLKNQSHVLAYLITDPYRRILPDFTPQMMLEEVKTAFLDEVTKLQQEPLSAEELERARRYTIGTYALQHQRIRDRAFQLGWLEAIGLGCEYDSKYALMIEAVTAADVQKVSKKYFNNYVMTIVLPEMISNE